MISESKLDLEKDASNTWLNIGQVTGSNAYIYKGLTLP